MGNSSSSVPPPPPLDIPAPPTSPSNAPPLHPPVAVQYPAGRTYTDESISRTQRKLEKAGPHRCGSRVEDFSLNLMAGQFSAIPSRIGLMVKCFRSPVGFEPRDDHTKYLSANMRPRWDPLHPWFDPYAPYDSFPRKIPNYKPTLPMIHDEELAVPQTSE